MAITTTYEGVRFEDLRDIMSTIIGGGGEHPFLSLHLNQGVAVTDTTHKWNEKFLKGHRLTLNEALDDSETGVDVTGYATAMLFNSTTNNKCWIQIDDEIMEVTAGAGTASLTVTRAAGGTTAAAHSNGASVEVLRHSVEGGDLDIDDVELGAKVTNYVQEYQYGIRMSDTSQNVNSPGNDLKLATQVEEKLTQALGILERDALLSNVKYANGAETQRRFAGLKYYSTKTASAQTLNDAFIQTAIATLLDNGANPNKLAMIVPSNLYNKVTALKDSRVASGGMSNTEKRIEKDYDAYIYSQAPVKIMRLFRMAPGQVCFYDTSKVIIAPQQGMAFRVEDIAKTGASEKKMLRGNYTMEVMNGAQCSLWYSSVS